MTKRFAIIGFGSQAKSWALNLKDSGYEVFIGLRKGSSSFKKVQELGFLSFELGQSFPCSSAALLTPDDSHLEAASLLGREPINLIFAHGYSLYFDQLARKRPHFNCLLLAPKAIASELRFQYETKGKIGGVYSVEYSNDQNKSESLVKELARDLGINSLHLSTCEAEAKADLFSEQALLCSTLPYSALFAFNKLIEKGIDAETAYFECWHEVKLIANAMVEMGPLKFFELISPFALVGSEKGKKWFFDEDYFSKLESLYQGIETGDFSNELKTVDFDKVKSEVVNFWKDQTLTNVHKKMAKDLY